MELLWSKFVVRLGQINPFFTCIALFTKFIPDEQVTVAQTAGKEIRVNPGFILDLLDEQAFSYLLHQILHLALLHDKRRQGRDPEVWNLAADIVINHIIVESTKWPVAPATAWDDRFAEDSVEQVYYTLIREIEDCAGPVPDGNEEGDSNDTTSEGDDGGNGKCPDNSDDGTDNGDGPDNGDNAGEDNGSKVNSTDAGDDQAAGKNKCNRDNAKDNNGHGEGGQSPKSTVTNTVLEFYRAHNDMQQQNDGDATPKTAEHEKYWEEAIVQAKYATKDKTQGSVPAGLKREFQRIERSRVDWRKELWRFVTDRQSDFSEFDVRHIHRGLYLEELRVDGLSMAIAVDTSGSISGAQLGVFMREVEEIQGLHGDVNISLYYCDAAVDGPYSLDGQKRNTNATPTGFGGTSFVPVFEAIEQLGLTDRPDCIVYFTDGFGEYPETSPMMQTLWVLVDEGVEDNVIPFGKTIRMPPLAA